MTKTIKKQLQELGFYSSNPFSQLNENKRLKQYLYTLGNTDKGWQFFYFLCERELSGRDAYWLYHPDKVAELGEKYCGSDQAHVLYEWVMTCDIFDPLSLYRKMNPPLLLDEDLFTILSRTGFNMFLTTIPEFEDIDMQQWDAEYIVPTKDQCIEIFKNSPSYKYEFIPERRDCDDFGKILWGWLAQEGYGNIAIGPVIFTCYDFHNTAMFAHLAMACVYKDNVDGQKKIMIGEPQRSNKFWNVEENAPWKNVNQTVYNFVIF